MKARKEGTRIYYYLEPQREQIEKLIGLFQDIRKIMSNVPERSGEMMWVFKVDENILRRNFWMDLQEAMEKRHSVRAYTAQKITGEVKERLQ